MFGSLTPYLKVLLSFIYFLLGFLIPSKDRELKYEVVKRLYQRYFPNEAKVPSIHLDQLFNSQAIELRETNSTDGNVSNYELYVLTRLISHYKPLKVMEFGTFNGRTTLNLAYHLPANGEIITIDLPDTDNDPKLDASSKDLRYIRNKEKGALFKNDPISEKITFIRADTAEVDLKEHFGTVDMVFIDAAHSKEYVKNDTDLAYKLVKKDKATIIWHDYDGITWPEVTDEVDDHYFKRTDSEHFFRILNTSIALVHLDKKANG